MDRLGARRRTRSRCTSRPGSLPRTSGNPPPPSAARSVFVELPHGVLALSRMVAVPHADRELRHVSKPLRVQMRRLIDRSRWPALVTWHDEGQGHTGHVYKCSGWQPTTRKRAETVEVDGRRVSRYSNGARVKRDDGVRGHTWIQRWEHWDLGDAVDERTAAIARFDASWERVAIPGRFWRSGSQAYRFVRRGSGARGIATK